MYNVKCNREKNLPSLFDLYTDVFGEMTQKEYKEVTKLRLINKVIMTIYLLEGFLHSVHEEKLTSEIVEMIFLLNNKLFFWDAYFIKNQRFHLTDSITNQTFSVALKKYNQYQILAD